MNSLHLLNLESSGFFHFQACLYEVKLFNQFHAECKFIQCSFKTVMIVSVSSLCGREDQEQEAIYAKILSYLALTFHRLSNYFVINLFQ